MDVSVRASATATEAGAHLAPSAEALLASSYAHWLTEGGIAWRIKHTPSKVYHLHWSASASLKVTGTEVKGADGSMQLELAAQDLPPYLARKTPHLSGCLMLALPEAAVEQNPELVTAQLAVSAQEPGGPLEATGVQLPGVLDECFFYTGPLGANLGADGVHFALWAPTAQSVELLLWDGPRGGTPEVQAMSKGRHGEWTHQGPSSLLWRYYTYRLRVYHPLTRKIETVEATDPYSRSLAADGARSQVADLSAPELQPEGWERHRSPPLASPSDISIYELHIRDFSASDASVPEELRGKYLAFAQNGSAGCRHLAALREAGMTHVHLLPSYDFGTVPEREEDRREPQGDLSEFAPNSPEQQRAVMEVADMDSFNWGYDPVHYGVPDGSYATNPDGPTRIAEFRSMVAALHAAGLRVVLDVVYNHTYNSGPHSVYSILDKIVPGYYHRYEESGAMCQSTCCNNTASENRMMERLMLDDITHWARDYKVDGFRFDIMGHHLVKNMAAVQAGLQGLTLERDGVDGEGLYLYGEAWDFGEMACNQRGRNASQLNIGGMGLGSFNDRFRDALIGGSPFSSPRAQGVVTGLGTRPNSFTQATSPPTAQLEEVLRLSDLLRLSMAGNLRSLQMEDCKGLLVAAPRFKYGAVPAAYARQPVETINYAACHDNETLWDLVALKADGAEDVEARQRMCLLAQAAVVLSQGIPFIHAGDDLLRSKSLDRDSYNSGDWFNRLDWSGATNNWGVGLPPAPKNEAQWGLKGPLLARRELAPPPELIARHREQFLELLRVRYSSPLFRLPSAKAVARQLLFRNTGPHQIPGAMALELVSADCAPPRDPSAVAISATGQFTMTMDMLNGDEEEPLGIIDPNYCRVLVIINAGAKAYVGSWPQSAQRLALHPALRTDPKLRDPSALLDSALRTITVPELTVGVFVEPRK